MAKEIAVFVDENGMTTFLPKACCLQIYRKQEGVWRKERNLNVNLGTTRGLAELRERMAEIIAFLDSCDTVVAEDFQGAALHELEKADVGMWKVSGSPEPALDIIIAEEEAAAQKKEQPLMRLAPVLEQQGNGRAYISIVEVQRNGGGLTSKQVLTPIMKQGSFTELEILCAHVPPWLEAEVVSRGWRCQVNKAPERQISLTITVT
ncbi:MAG: Fe-only nitrogenase accessory AnfO family protein [Negativicutes bacterium]